MVWQNAGWVAFDLPEQRVYVLQSYYVAPHRNCCFVTMRPCFIILSSICAYFRNDADAVCGGFGGLLNSNANGDTCCPASCGVCTFNDGCTAGTTFEECCPWKIRRDSEVCSGSESAPCNRVGERSDGGQQGFISWALKYLYLIGVDLRVRKHARNRAT